mgnify:FL=1
MRLQWPETRQILDRKVEATPTIATPSRDVIIRLADLSVAKTNIAWKNHPITIIVQYTLHWDLKLAKKCVELMLSL